MTHPRITLITPSLNQGAFLEQTICSVLDQKYPNLEYMVIDGGSNDQSPGIIKKYADQLSWWTSEKDHGQPHAINKGLKRATGEIVGWINSDDYLEMGSLFRVAENFHLQGVNCVIGKISYFNRQGALWKSENVVRQPEEKTLGSGVVPQPAMYFARSCYEKIGLLNEQLHFCFDSEWYMRYLMHYGTGSIREIPDLLVHFRFHEDSKTISNGLRFREERNSICYSIAKQTGQDELAGLLLKLYRPDPEYIFSMPEIKKGLSVEKAMNYLVLLLADEYYAAGDRKNATLCFKSVKEYLLEPADKKYYRKLSFRNSWIPRWILKGFRKNFAFFNL